MLTTPPPSPAVAVVRYAERIFPRAGVVTACKHPPGEYACRTAAVNASLQGYCFTAHVHRVAGRWRITKITAFRPCHIELTSHGGLGRLKT